MRTDRIKYILFFLLALPIAFFFVFPYLWNLSLSFKSLAEFFAFPPTIIPKNPTIENFKTILLDVNFRKSVINSFVTSGLYVVFATFVSALAGYSFAKFDFRFKNILFIIAIGSMMIPLHIVIIPLFLEMRTFKLYDTFFALTLPFAASPFGTFFIRQSMRAVPDELLDSARIDGASEFKIFSRIVIPLTKGPISALAIYFFFVSWNSFMWPSVIANERFTIPLYLYRLANAYHVEYNLVAAASILYIIPIAIIFVFVQKQFVEGLTAGALKQ